MIGPSSLLCPLCGHPLTVGKGRRGRNPQGDFPRSSPFSMAEHGNVSHKPVLVYATEKWPIRTLSTALTMILALYVLFQGVAEAFRRLPLLRRIV